MKEIEIGDVLNYEGVSLQIEKADEKHLCLGCYFNRSPHCYRPYDDVGSCVDIGRKRENIIFKEVKE